MTQRQQFHFREDLVALLSESTDSYDRRRRARAKQATTAGRVVVFGPGHNGRRLARSLRASGVEVAAFLSDRTPCDDVDGHPVFSPREAAERFGEGVYAIVSPFSPGHSYRRTRDRLATMKIQAVSLFEVIGVLPELLPFYFFDGPGAVHDGSSALLSLFDSFFDRTSRLELLEHVRFRLSGDLSRLNEPLGEPFEFFRGLVDGKLTFIDGGAFDGDTVRSFLATFGDDVRRIEAFEPDAATFPKLQEYAHSLSPRLRSNLAVHECGIWSAPGRVGFATTGTLASSISSDASTSIAVTSVDAILADDELALVKLDVEGAEGDAIDGARRAIRDGRALFALAVYHRPRDLWELPRRILMLNPSYRFALRSHAHDGADLMLYALPPDAAERARLRENA